MTVEFKNKAGFNTKPQHTAIHSLEGNQARIALLYLLQEATDNVDLSRMRKALDIAKSYQGNIESRKIRYLKNLTTV